MRPNGDPVQVLYVAGWIYSGSTLLANILGELDGVVAACEVRRIWRLGLLDDRPCGCGAAFSACPFWQAVMAEAFGGADGIDGERVATVDERLVLNRRFPQLLLAGRGVGHEAAELREYAAILSRLYAAIRSVSGCRVVVDTSKSPLFGLILSWLPDIDLRVAHLVRDARGTLYSARRRVGHPFSPATGLLLYDFWHAVTELWLRRRRWRSVSPGPCSFATAISARVVHRDKGATRPSQPSERATNASFTRLVSLPS